MRPLVGIVFYGIGGAVSRTELFRPRALTPILTVRSRINMFALAAALFTASLAFAADPLDAQPARPAAVGPAPTGAAVQVATPRTSNPAGYQIVVEGAQFRILPLNSPDFGEKTVTVLCPAGKLVLGGGYYHSSRMWKDFAQFLEVAGSGPTETGNGWRVRISSSSPTLTVSGAIELYAICSDKQ
ncbi:MAG: hypothetical protein M3Z54_10795 [Gemmatimonadota bacterium]|nr:hypothetical protein [Gemmatimonadota bacterium]